MTNEEGGHSGEVYEATITYRFRSHSVSRAASVAESAANETQWVRSLPEVIDDELEAEVESLDRIPGEVDQ